MGVCHYDLKELDPIEVAKSNVLKKAEKPTDKPYEHKEEWKPYDP